jgi:hypothetical protein
MPSWEYNDDLITDDNSTAISVVTMPRYCDNHWSCVEPHDQRLAKQRSDLSPVCLSRHRSVIRSLANRRASGIDSAVSSILKYWTRSSKKTSASWPYWVLQIMHHSNRNEDVIVPVYPSYVLLPSHCSNILVLIWLSTRRSWYPLETRARNEATFCGIASPRLGIFRDESLLLRFRLFINFQDIIYTYYAHSIVTLTS